MQVAVETVLFAFLADNGPYDGDKCGFVAAVCSELALC